MKGLIHFLNSIVNERKTVIIQGIKYGMIGVCGLTSNLLIFSFLVYILKVWYIVSGILAGWLSMTQNFILHRKFTFKGYSNFKVISLTGIKRYARFWILSLVNIPLFSSLLYTQVEFLHLPKVIAQFNASLIGGVINFIVARRFIFHPVQI